MTDRDHFAAAALTGLLAQGDDGSFSEESYVRGAYRWADAMLRERAKTNHDAAPEATAGTPGTGDTPKPISGCVSDRSKPITGPDPDSRVWETPVHTPAPHATPGDGSVPREGTQEPVAWGVANGKGLLATSISRIDAVDMQSDYACDTEIVPLYRQPTLTDAERGDLQMWLAECLRQCSTATEGANEELAERWQGRAKRAAAMIERLGGVE